MKKIIFTTILFHFYTICLSQVTVCKGNSKNFKVTATAGSTYSWTVSGTGYSGTIDSSGDGDGSINDEDITVVWGTTPIGKYTVSVLETTTSTGCSAAAPQTIDVYIIGNPTVAVSNDEVCFGLTKLISPTYTTGTLTGIASEPSPTGSASYSWTSGSGSFTASTSTITKGTQDTYSIKWTDAYGCVSNLATMQLTVNPLPPTTITAGGPITFCNTGSVTLNAPTSPTSPTTGILTYDWKKGGVSVPATTQAYTATTSGVYTVTVTDTKGCVATTNPGITVTVNPLPSVTIIASALEICSGSTAVLTGQPIDGSTGTTPTGTSPYTGWSYNWTIDPSTTSIGSSINYGAQATGKYILTVTDPNGCTAKDDETITVRPKPNPTIVPTSSVICAGSSTSLTDTQTIPSGSSFTYKWNKNGTFTGIITKSLTISSLTSDNTSTDNYTLDVLDNAYTTNCATTSSAVPVTVNKLPVTSAIIPY